MRANQFVSCPVCGQTPCNCTHIAEGLRDPKDNPCWKGYHPVGTKKKNGRTVPNCVPNTNEGAAEGLGKSIKRGIAGWGAFDKDKPADVVKRVKGQDTDTLKGLSRTGPTGRGSPAELQQKAISRELKKREQQGVAEGPGFDKWADERAASQLHKLKKPHPETWHDVDKKLGRAVDKMSQAEKVKKGLAHPDTLKKKGVAEGFDDNKVEFEVDSENAYNHIMKKFGSVIDWDGDTMVAPRKYWGSIQELAYAAGGEATEVGNEQGVAEGSKWRADDLEGKTWRSPDWDDGDLSPSKIKIDRSGKDVDDSGDELTSRPGMWRGKADMAKRMTKKGVPTKSELAFQNNLKMRMRMKKKEGGLTGPKGSLPEQGVAEGYTGRETKDGTWRVFKDGQAVAVAGPFKSRDEAHAWIKNQKQGVAEDRPVDSDGYTVDREDAGEYDYEGDQAKDQLQTIVAAARKLNGMLDDNENMPEWVQMKITKATDYLDTAADYVAANKAQAEPMAESEPEKIGGRHDPADFDDMVSRLKKLAGAGPMRTAYDTNTRRYKNVPTAPQPGDKK